VRLGWAKGVANPDPATACGRVFLLRGNGIIFSLGLGAVCRELRKAGIWAADLRCVGDLWVRRRLTADHRDGRLRGPIVLVGHSCGGRYALFTAQQLQATGIAVDLVVCLDVAGPFPVAANVKRAVHIFLTRNRIYPARPLRPALGSAAVIENIDLNAPGSPVNPDGLNHLNITDSPAVQALVLRRIRETIL